MIKLNTEQLNEIAQELECGMSCYVHKLNGEMIFIPNTDQFDELEMDAWEDDLNKVKENEKKYLRIDPPDSRESFAFMEEFIESLDPNDLLTRLLANAIERKHPFRGFKDIIDESGKLREEWFAFKNAKLHEWVKKEIAYFEDEQED